MATTWQEIRPPARGWTGVSLPELWAFRDLAYNLVLRDLKSRYKQAFLGIAWALLQPLLAMAIFTVVFGHFTNLPSNGVPYAVFVMIGLTAWLFFASAVSTAAGSLVDQRALLTRIYFPRAIAPVAALGAPLVDLAVSLVLTGIVMAVAGVAPGAPIITLPVWLLALVTVTVGVALWLSALQALYRDVRLVLVFLLQIWWYVSPIVYPSSILHGLARTLFALNPMMGVIDGLRWSLGAGPPPALVDVLSLASGLGLLIGGVAYFSAAERRFVDRI